MNLEPVPLASLAAVRAGGGAPQEATAFGTSGLPFVRAGSLPKLLDGAGEDGLEKIEPEVADQYGLKVFPAGTVLFAKSGMSATKGYVYRLRGSAYVVSHLAALIPHDVEDAAFLERALQRFSPTALIRDAAYPSIRLGEIESMKVLAPRDSMDRRRIAEILDKADALRAKRRAALAQLDTLIQLIFLDMFGDPATNPKGWSVTPLSCLVRDDDNINYGVVQPGDDVEGGVPLIRVGDLAGGTVRRSGLKRIASSIEAAYKRSRLCGDEILVSCVGSVGVVALADESLRGFNIARAVARIPLAETANRLFVAAYLNTAYVQQYFVKELRTVSQPTLNIKQISETTVVLPPIEMQLEFARRASALSQLEAAHCDALTELDALFASLQDRAFRGRL